MTARVSSILLALCALACITCRDTGPPPAHPAAPPTSATAPASRPAPAVDLLDEHGRPMVYGGVPRCDSATVTILKNRGYMVGYCDARRNPLWAAYRVWRVADAKTFPRPGRFSTDSRTKAAVRHDDYTNSGYDRGHMAPNYAIASRYGREAQLETFLMSNICPQSATLNRGTWEALESKEARDFADRLEEIWVVCGPIFSAEPAVLPSGVQVSKAFYKIIVDEDRGQVRALAFVMKQDVDTTPDLSTFLTTVDEIEKATGLDFLGDLPDSEEDRVERTKANDLWP